MPGAWARPVDFRQGSVSEVLSAIETIASWEPTSGDRKRTRFHVAQFYPVQNQDMALSSNEAASEQNVRGMSEPIRPRLTGADAYATGTDLIGR